MAATCVNFSPDGKMLGLLRPSAPGGTSSTLFGVDISTGEVSQLVSVDAMGDTEATLSAEEKLRRERQRSVTTGITSYVWTSKGAAVFPAGGSLYHLVPGSGAPPSLLYDKASGGGAAVIDPQPSADGELLAFVRNSEVHVLPLPAVAAATEGTTAPSPVHAPATAVQVTTGAAEKGWTNGLADYIAQEEFDRFTGLWWSPSGHRFLAFQQTDETHIPEYRIAHTASADPAEDETHRYPFAGATNGKVRIAVLDVDAAMAAVAAGKKPVEPVWMDLGQNPNMYVVRVQWMSGEAGGVSDRDPHRPAAATATPVLLVQLLNRAQNVLDLVRYDIATGRGVLLVREVAYSSEAWLNTSHLLTPLSSTCLPQTAASSPAKAVAGTRFFLFGSERDGWQHLYLYAMPAHASFYENAPQYWGVPRSYQEAVALMQAGAEGEGEDADADNHKGVAVATRAVTTGQWMVEAVVGVGGSNGASGGEPSVFFYGTLDSPLERHLYVAPIFLVGGDGEDVTQDYPYGASAIRRLTSGAGMHTVVMSKDCASFADSLSSLHGPSSLAVYSFDPTARYATSPFKVSASSGSSGSSSIGTPGSPLAGGGAFSVGSASKSRSRIGGVLDAEVPVNHPMRDVVSAVVNFDKTGAYGPRISVGVRLVALPHGSLPSPSVSGTPASYNDARVQLMQIAARGSKGLGNGGSSGVNGSEEHPLAKLVASTSAALDGFAAAVTSGIGRIESLGERAGALLAGISPADAASNAAQVQAGIVAAAPAAAPASATVAVVTPPPQPLSPDSANAGVTSTVSSTAETTTQIAAVVQPTASPAHVLAPVVVTIPAADGTTRLYASLHLPDPAVYGYGPYPTVVSVYGGPHVQRIKHDWAHANELRAQALRRAGFCVLVVDNRGSSRRGLQFELPIRHRMGSVEVEDQAAAVKYFARAGLVDAGRVGIYGWSYGGYMTLMCLAKAADTFHVGVSGAPVTSWDGYDTGYTERYMGTPKSNPTGYASSSVMTHAGSITGHLLLVHGLMDENVHWRHTARLIQTLIERNINYDLLLFPQERHLPRGVADKAYMENRIMRYFERHLMRK
jgi:dienelactone hydrolase